MPEAYALGGFNTGISTMQLAGAYAAFGNNGTYTKPYTVRKVVFPDGREISLEPESTPAMSDYTAYMITDMLKTAVTNGTGGVANIPGLDMAGKTGTTNFSEDQIASLGIPQGGVPSVWFSGYTTNYTAAVWSGFARNSENNYLGSQQERQLSQQIFNAVMSEVSADIETPDFTMPNSVVRVGVERSTGLLPSEFTPQSEIVYELFVRGNEPTRVSEQFIELASPSGFMASYEEEANQILLSWDYPNELADSVTFELQVSVNGGSPQTLDRMKEMQYIYSSPEQGSSYVFTLVAISDENSNLRSDPATVEVIIEEESEEEDIIPDPLEEMDEIEQEPAPIDEEEDQGEEESPPVDEGENEEQPTPNPEEVTDEDNNT